MGEYRDYKDSALKQTHQFIFSILHSFIHGKRGCTPLPDGPDWKSISSITCRHNLGPIFKYVFSDYRKIPETVVSQWTLEQEITFVRNTRALLGAIKLCRTLDRASIPVAVIRGLALSGYLYPAASLRPMSDVDMLIREDDRKDVAVALEGEGFFPVKLLRSQLVYHIDGTVFEMHWSLLTPKRYRRAVDGKIFLESKKSMILPEGRIYHLSRENELIGLVTHAFIHHELEGILPLVDITLLVKASSLDWQFIAEWCRQARLSRMFHLTLSLVDHLFDLRLNAILDIFGKSLPNRQDKVYEAYMMKFLGADNFSYLMRRKQNLFYVAESSLTKFKQALRIFSDKEIRSFLKSKINAEGTLCKK